MQKRYMAAIVLSLLALTAFDASAANYEVLAFNVIMLDPGGLVYNILSHQLGATPVVDVDPGHPYLIAWASRQNEQTVTISVLDVTPRGLAWHEISSTIRILLRLP